MRVLFFTKGRESLSLSLPRPPIWVSQSVCLFDSVFLLLFSMCSFLTVSLSPWVPLFLSHCLSVSGLNQCLFSSHDLSLRPGPGSISASLTYSLSGAPRPSLPCDLSVSGSGACGGCCCACCAARAWDLHPHPRPLRRGLGARGYGSGWPASPGSPSRAAWRSSGLANGAPSAMTTSHCRLRMSYAGSWASQRPQAGPTVPNTALEQVSNAPGTA